MWEGGGGQTIIAKSCDERQNFNVDGLPPLVCINCIAVMLSSIVLLSWAKKLHKDRLMINKNMKLKTSSSKMLDVMHAKSSGKIKVLFALLSIQIFDRWHQKSGQKMP